MVKNSVPLLETVLAEECLCVSEVAFAFCEGYLLFLRIAARYYSSNILDLNPPLRYKPKHTVYVKAAKGILCFRSEFCIPCVPQLIYQGINTLLLI